MSEMIHLKLQPVEGNSTYSTFSTTSIPPLKKSRPTSIKPIWDRSTFSYTVEDWKIIMDEIKELYLTRQYKQCTARCIEILDSITDHYRVHPLYSLFMYFYCATCLEITATNLHHNSPQKLSLLRDSLSYFQKAEECITYAEIPIESNGLSPGNRSSSISSSSSARSSVDSVFSSTSFPSTVDELSPVFSSCSFEDDGDKTPPRRRTLSESTVASTQSTQSTDIATIIDKPAPLHLEDNTANIEAIPRAIQSPVTPLRPIISSKYQSPSPTHPPLNTHLTSYNLNLSSLTTQLTYHITHVNDLIDTLQNIRKSRRSNQSSYAPSLFDASGDLNDEENEELARKDIRERIEKLKSAGWERKRWDGSRYKALREKVENELAGWI